MKYKGQRRQDWLLLEAFAAQKQGNTKKANDLYRTLIEFNSEKDPPYEPNAEAIAYAGRIAQIAGFSDGLIKKLREKYQEKLEEEQQKEQAADLLLGRNCPWDLNH